MVVVCTEEMSELTGRINAGQAAERELEALCKEAQQCLNKLELANQSFQGEWCDSHMTTQLDVTEHTPFRVECSSRVWRPQEDGSVQEDVWT